MRRQEHAEAAAAEAAEQLHDTRQELAHCEQELILYRSIGEKYYAQQAILADQVKPVNQAPHVQGNDGPDKQVTFDGAIEARRYGDGSQLERSHVATVDASTNTDLLCWDDSAASQALLADIRFRTARHELIAVTTTLKMRDREASYAAKAALLAGLSLQRRKLNKWRSQSKRQKTIKSAFILSACPYIFRAGTSAMSGWSSGSWPGDYSCTVQN